MKTKLLSLLFAIVASIGTIFANGTEIDGICYVLNSSDMTASVTYRGSDNWNSYANITTITIPSSVSYMGQSYNVTSIGYKAFSGCSSLTSIAIPNSVTNIGESAFDRCSSLNSITIPNSVTSIGVLAFYLCSSLTEINIPEGVTSIEGQTFYGCSNLTTVNIPSSVTIIAAAAFRGCSSLTSITIPENITTIETCAFADCSSLIGMEWNAKNCADFGARDTPFYYYFESPYGVQYNKLADIRSQITSFAFGDKVEHVPAYLCSGLGNIANITIPQSVTSIGAGAFSRCGITSVTIPSSVTSIGSGAFNCGLNLVYCELGAPLSISENTFPSTATIYIPNCAFSAFSVAPVWKDLTIAPVSVNLAVMNNTGGVVVENCGQMEIEAIPYIGYQFRRWQDGNTENPRKYTLSQTNRNFIAEFELKKHQITLTCDASQGSITGDQGKFNYDTEHTIEAVPNYGYHFTQWSDGKTENPREFTLEQDTTFTALFAPNKYNLIIQYDNTYGDVVGEQGTFDYLSEHSIRVNAKYGYYFVSWSDGVTDNPRTLVLTKDTTITASFAPNKYTFEAIANAIMGTVTGEQGEFDYLTDHTIEAVPNYGYHFTQWSDGETENPREFTLEQDTTFTALFAPNKYNLTIQYDNTYGDVVGEQGTFDYLSEHSIQVNAKYGYHFVSWSDGVTDNPRTLVLTKDTTITASFAPNKYTLEVLADATMGTITGEQGEFDYLTEHTVEAVPNTGYLFTGWSDGITENPRTIILLMDTSVTALFEHNLYNITVLCNEEQGAVEATGEFYEGGTCTITATPNNGYHFTQWSDGNTENPRSITVTKDETFTAEFAIDKSGTCGDNLALTWTYDSDTKEMTISGDGALNSNYTFGIEAPTSVEKLTIAEGVTAIGNSAFANYTTIQEIVFATSVKTLYEQAFYNCANLISIYCYRERPCVVYSNTFDGVDKFDCTLYVPTASIDMYKAATGWRDFYFIEAISGTTTAIENSSTSQQNVHKIIRNGQIFILRDGKTYTVQGQEVK